MKKPEKLTPSQWLDELSGKESVSQKLDYFIAASIGWGNIGIGAGLIGLLLITLILNFYLRAPIIFYNSENFLPLKKISIVLGIILYAIFSSFLGYCQFSSYESKKPTRILIYCIGFILILVSVSLITHYVIPQCLFSDLRGGDTPPVPI